MKREYKCFIALVGAMMGVVLFMTIPTPITIIAGIFLIVDGMIMVW